MAHIAVGNASECLTRDGSVRSLTLYSATSPSLLLVRPRRDDPKLAQWSDITARASLGLLHSAPKRSDEEKASTNQAERYWLRNSATSDQVGVV